MTDALSNVPERSTRANTSATARRTKEGTAKRKRKERKKKKKGRQGEVAAARFRCTVFPGSPLVPPCCPHRTSFLTQCTDAPRLFTTQHNMHDTTRHSTPLHSTHTHVHATPLHSTDAAHSHVAAQALSTGENGSGHRAHTTKQRRREAAMATNAHAGALSCTQQQRSEATQGSRACVVVSAAAHMAPHRTGGASYCLPFPSLFRPFLSCLTVH
jgi:hypothetical protein